MTSTLLPLYLPPAEDPGAWRAAVAAGEAASGPLTVVLSGAGRADPATAEAAAQLASAGVATLGRVDAAFATRPIADLLDDIGHWATRPVSGIFLDRAPTSPYCLGPVALASRVARRIGLATVLLNPGVPTDPLYRDLGVAICTFEGPWPEYQRWSTEGSLPGDGHLVHSVPMAALPQARRLLCQRRAGFGLVTDGRPPHPYAGLPAWLP
jgi:hypothetical protein